MGQQLPTYFEPHQIAKLQGLRLRARHIVEGYVAGLHRSPYHGFSIEFAEHRPYAPGDDLRQLDWKAYGRSDKLYLKQFEDETNLVCHLVLDSSASMAYRGDPAGLSKFEYAKCLAASLGWLILQQQDAIGMVTFGSKVRRILPPSGKATQLLQLVKMLEQEEPAEKTQVGRVLHELAHRYSKRGVVIVLSDLFDDLDAIASGLRHLRHRRHDVILMHVLDPIELDFPLKGMKQVRSLEGGPTVRVDAQQLRKAYRAEVQGFLDSLGDLCRGTEVEMVLARTDQPFDLILNRYLKQRMHRVR